MIINIIHKLFQEETNLALKLSNQLFLPFHNLLSNPAQTYTQLHGAYICLCNVRMASFITQIKSLTFLNLQF